MKQLLRGTLLFLFLFLFFVAPQSAAAANIRVYLDDTPILFTDDPFIENDRVLVPLRGILEALGYHVQWQEDTQTVLATGESVEISLRINEMVATVNGKAVAIDAPAKIKNDRTFVPLRFLSEYSGAKVIWNPDDSSVSIYAASSAETKSDSIVYLQTNQTQGSGIILSADGLIATNYHVIENASTAQFVFADGSVCQGEATVVGLNPSADIALLKIEKSGLTPAKTSLSYHVGDAVSAIGSPDGQRNTVTEGVINSFDADVISASAIISHGSSGGGLFNSEGEVIGMTSFYGGGKYFSIPIAQVLAVPQNLSLPLSEMKTYTYTAAAPQNLRFRSDEDGYVYISWALVYNAEYYYVYRSDTADGPYIRLRNSDGEKWYWGHPYCFGISATDTCYLRVSVVVDGKESPYSDAIKISN